MVKLNDSRLSSAERPIKIELLTAKGEEFNFYECLGLLMSAKTVTTKVIPFDMPPYDKMLGAYAHKWVILEVVIDDGESDAKTAICVISEYAKKK